MSRRQRTITAKRTTTEELTVTETHDDTTPAAFAPGWDALPGMTRSQYLGQRREQVGRCLNLLELWDASAEPGAEPPESLVRDAVTILRAGPGATPMEQLLGRS